jgi:hypothetical protein
MARTLVIEEESGTSRGHVHPHNGYYAGDFSRSIERTPDPAPMASPFSNGGSDVTSLRLHPNALPVHQSARPDADSCRNRMVGTAACAT